MHNRTADDNVPAHYVDLIFQQVDMCLREITKKEHELMLQVGDENIPVSYKAAKGSCRVHVTKRGGVSTGGFHGIKIDISQHDFPYAFLSEYKRIANDPVIGSTDVIGPQLTLFCIVAHEVAHHIQRKYAPMTRIYRNGDFKPHGQVWQDIYRILRSRVVNPLINEELARRSERMADRELRLAA